MSTPEKHFAYAAAYLELRLFSDARAELSGLSADFLASSRVLPLRLAIALADGAWAEVIDLAPALIAHDSSKEQPWVAWAYALRELEQVTDAQETLLTAARLISEPSIVVSYNLACYACLLGELDQARHLLEQVFARDEHWREAARTDPDLAALYPESK
ncbi:MAG: hypothetical protein EAZ36_02850 [Verrucomicrobia bacterium]|nr:MAG: hypothetical protein EAZ36_02850 [Verrucomicrobiota bacterium]